VEISESDSKQKFSRKTGQYVHALASLIKRVFGVEAYFSNRTNNIPEQKLHAVFFGQEERPVIASYCFDVLYRQLQQARKAFIATQSKRLKRSTLIARADNYCLGWVHGVYKEGWFDKKPALLQRISLRISSKNVHHVDAL